MLIVWDKSKVPEDKLNLLFSTTRKPPAVEKHLKEDMPHVAHFT